jgi:hypothetical protein
MRALVTAIIYFGSFMVLGWLAKRALDSWTASRGSHPSEVQGQSGEGRPRRTRFLLGVWYK